MTRTDKEQAVKYLLGDLTEVERDAIEERFFTDEDFSQFMDEAETDLIDDFARGDLSERQNQLFSRNFLVSEKRREKTRTAQILQNELFAKTKGANSVSLAATAEQTSFWTSLTDFFRAPQIAFAAFAVLLLIFGGWFLTRDRSATEVAKGEESKSSTTPFDQPAANVQPSQPNVNSFGTNTVPSKNATLANKAVKVNQSNAEEKPTNEQKTKPPAIQPTFASLLLLPATRSSSQSQTLNLKTNVRAVNLQIVNDREEDFDRFRVEVRNIDGALISAQEFKNTNYNRKNFNVQIASAKLAPADYQVTLQGADVGAPFQNLNYFYFSIEKK